MIFFLFFYFVRKSPNSWRTIILFYAVGTQKSTSRSTREKETAESFSRQELRVPYTYYSMYFYLLIGEGSGSHRRKVTQDFSTFLQNLRCLPWSFFARRIQPSFSLVRWRDACPARRACLLLIINRRTGSWGGAGVFPGSLSMFHIIANTNTTTVCVALDY